ncbi:M20 family metallopeptidase [Paenibacillus sp. J2TS4]|uniref:M20 metallopeptidase family protein n=1 Tax=Paenibacillus sp. J2TS4 TaxID=2807194 RepID=UPI001B295909|nr:M20 family metallopeptidase [Paenibacillus sp. J2TS4]GIP32921.1 putative amidohydrolase YhaA [Paenibacillus sp. J2TS4]
MNIEQSVEQIYPDMVSWRRHLHRHPELSYQEKETSRFVAERLTSLGLEVERNVGGYGVTALLRGGRPGPTVALRADMDALPIQDEKKVEYASKVAGVMHACGHDAHTAQLLGAAAVLAPFKRDLSGNVRFIFQPAEEISPGGASAMIADGVLKDVDVIYGVHLWSPFPSGSVYSAEGPIMANADEMRIEITGKGGHGGLPHETVDSVVVGSHLVVNLQTIVSRNVNPTIPAVLSIGSIHAGSGFNVIADQCILNGTVRTFDSGTRDQIRNRISEIAEQTCAMHGAAFKLEYKEGYPAVVNHVSEAQRFVRIGRQLYGEDRVRSCAPIMASEDFSYYLQKIPGCFIFVGAQAPGSGTPIPHHHPLFDIDENAMKQAACLLIGLTLDYLNERSL